MVLALLWISCDPGRQVDDAWRVVDLTRVPAEVDGPGRPRIPTTATVDTLRERRMKAVQHGAEHRLSWNVQLGRRPWLSFRPDAVAGRCELEALVRGDGEEPVSVFRRAVQPRDVAQAELTGDPLGEAVEVDLAAFAGRSVELIFQTTEGSDASCLARWVTPTVTSRGTVLRRRGEQEQRPNIVLVAADTLRADALGAWGKAPSVTPTLDRLAVTGDVWLNTYASSNATNPSFVSLMTGLYVQSHGVFDHETPLPASERTLAEVLRGAG